MSKWAQLPNPVDRADIETGARARGRDLTPADRAGVQYVTSVVLSADDSAYAYKYRLRLSDLFFVDGLR